MANSNKNPLKKQKVFWTVLMAFAGFVAGYFILTLIPNHLDDASLYAIPFLLFLFFFCYLLHVVVHEVGHLILGLWTGYSFVSLRIGQLTLVKVGTQFKWSRVNVPGTGGQCLMDPPPYNGGDFPFLLYNLGGILFNSVLAFLFLLLPDANYSFLLNALLVNFGLAGVFAAISNALPVKINGIPTDGYNIWAIYRNQTIKQAFWLQLKGNALLTEGVEPKDLPMDEFYVENLKDLVNPIMTSAQLFLYYHYLDRLDFKKAKECLEVLLPCLNQLLPVYQNEIKLEWLFLELIGKNDPNIVEKLYDASFDCNLRLTENWLNRKRFFMAYEWFHQHDALKALARYRELQELAAGHPVLGEAKMELRLAEWLKKQFTLT